MVTTLVLGSIESDTRPGDSYPIQYNQDVLHRWLSCNCKSFTTGKWNKGKEIYERECKHTLKAMRVFSGRLIELGYDVPGIQTMRRSESILAGVATQVEITNGASVRRLK